jgi:hypothetical protein
MASPNPDDMLLLIRCPSCGQRFKVGEDLRGRTVECGGCEHHFRINDEVIVRGRKIYPGERKDTRLDRFQRVPLSKVPDAAGISTMRYAEAPDPQEFEPVAPQRVIAGVVGVAGMAFMALLLMFGSNRGGALDGMTTRNRLLIAGFTGLLGIVLLVYANPRARGKAIAAGLLLSGGLMALPWFFTVGSVPLGSIADGPRLPVAPPRKAISPEDERINELRGVIGTGPLESELVRLATEGGNRKAVGLWLRGLREQNRYLVRDYVLRVTGADPPLIMYPRGNGEFLMVASGLNHSLDEVAKIAEALGSVEKVYPEMSVVEVRINNESFVTGLIEKLTDKGDPAFYDLNKRELESIDLERVKRAVQRLAEAEPKLYRSDITQKLISLVGAQWVDFKGEVCSALSVWSEKPGPAGDAALKELKGLLSRKKEVPKEMMALIVKENNPAVIPFLDALWFEDPTRWEALYGEFGPLAESSLIQRFPTTDGTSRQSAVRLLGRVGGAESLPLLQAAVGGADSELKVLIEKATASIRGRLAP